MVVDHAGPALGIVPGNDSANLLVLHPGHLSLLGDRNDPRVADAIRQVNQARLDLLAHTYRELGLPPDRAASRARVAYAAILGLLHLAQTDPDAPRSAVLADEATAVFLPS